MMRHATQQFAGYTSAIAILLFASSAPLVSAVATEKPLEPCTIRSHSSNAFFDLMPISKHLPTEKDIEKHKHDPEPFVVKSWHARGYDYGANFTINFCAPVVENITNVQGVDEKRWGNVSAYYEKGGRTYSIGQTNMEPVFRGRKLVLNYTDGSPCPGSSSPFNGKKRRSANLRRQLSAPTEHELMPHQSEDLNGDTTNRPYYGSDEDDELDDNDWQDELNASNSTTNDGVRRKSTIFSLFCERESLTTKAFVSFVGTMDECTYFFEVRSQAACAGIETAKQSLGPGSVFGVIAIIAILVYIVGGCVYQRTVMHQRGWRQLPNYNLWSGIGNALVDFFISATSSCARFLPKRRGYSRVSANGGYGRGRGNHNDDENRLIDQLDEEWDD